MNTDKETNAVLIAAVVIQGLAVTNSAATAGRGGMHWPIYRRTHD